MQGEGGSAARVTAAVAAAARQGGSDKAESVSAWHHVPTWKLTNGHNSHHHLLPRRAACQSHPHPTRPYPGWRSTNKDSMNRIEVRASARTRLTLPPCPWPSASTWGCAAGPPRRPSRAVRWAPQCWAAPRPPRRPCRRRTRPQRRRLKGAKEEIATREVGKRLRGALLHGRAVSKVHSVVRVKCAGTYAWGACVGSLRVRVRYKADSQPRKMISIIHPK